MLFLIQLFICSWYKTNLIISFQSNPSSQLEQKTLQLTPSITNCGKFLKRWEYQTILPASWETCMQVKKQQLEPDMEQWNGSKLGKEYIKAVCCHLACSTYMHHAKCWAGQSSSWNQDCWEKYQKPHIYRWHHPYGRKWRGTKGPLDESERGEWKSWLKT